MDYISQNLYQEKKLHLYFSREAVIIGGDFNAKTKSKFNNFPTNITDKYAKREINIRGEKMTEFCVMNNLKTIWTQTYPSNNMAITSPIL